MHIILTSERAIDMSYMGEAYASQFEGATRTEVLVACDKDATSADICAHVAQHMDGCCIKHTYSLLNGAAVVEVLDF